VFEVLPQSGNHLQDKILLERRHEYAREMQRVLSGYGYLLTRLGEDGTAETVSNLLDSRSGRFDYLALHVDSALAAQILEAKFKTVAAGEADPCLTR
jgi:hypothetical protein